MRSSDPRWLVPATNWLQAVGRQLSGLQVTKGGPILMVQVENEYGLHGGDVAYMRVLRQAVLDAGFEVPLYACNPPRVMQNGFIPELFQAANFGAEPEQRFEIVRKYQPPHSAHHRVSSGHMSARLVTSAQTSRARASTSSAGRS